MNAESRQEKIASIQKQFNALFCFSAEEIDKYLREIDAFAEEGLDAFMNFLHEAKTEQDTFFTSVLKQDPDFATKFSRFLNQTSFHIKNQYETKEHSNAEDILSNLDTP